MIMGAEHNLTCTIKLDNLYKLHIINIYQISVLRSAETVADGGRDRRREGGGGIVWRLLLFSLLRKMMKPSSFKLVVKIPSYTPCNCLNEDDRAKRILVPQSILWDAFS